MNDTLESSDPVTLTIATPAGVYKSELLTEAEVLALAQFAKQLSWSDFTSHASGDDEAHLMKQALDKLQDILARSGYTPY